MSTFGLKVAPETTHQECVDLCSLGQGFRAAGQAKQSIGTAQAADGRATLEAGARGHQAAVILLGRGHNCPVILWADRVGPDVVAERDGNLRQTRPADAREALEGRKNEEVEGDERRRRVTREREDGLGNAVTAAVLDGNGGEGSRLAGLHGDAAKVDGAAQATLDSGL